MVRETMAITYDVCDVEQFCIDMNQYKIDLNKDLKQQAYEFAKTDIASLVEIVEVVKEHKDDECGEFKTITEFVFEEFKCKCERGE